MLQRTGRVKIAKQMAKYVPPQQASTNLFGDGGVSTRHGGGDDAAQEVGE